AHPDAVTAAAVLLSGRTDRALVAAVVGHTGPRRPVTGPPIVRTTPAEVDLSLLPHPGADTLTLARAAGHAGRLLPPGVHDALVDFVDEGTAAGALLLRGLPVGDLPLTPAHPSAPTAKDRVSEFVLLTVGRRLGQPIGYQPEHGGDLVQNIVPTSMAAAQQVSTSSAVELMFHTEAAFHPHRPRYLLLLCLRGDPSAHTTLASIRPVLTALPLAVRRTLFEARFRTAADESYVGSRPTRLGHPVPVLRGDWDDPTMVFDADLMVGTDTEAEDALTTLAATLAEHRTSVALEPGDLLVVDNAAAVHGRTPFTPRFDGTDRWLQRTFVVADLAASADERTGRVVTTRFAP
ncbi:MAG: TauD/TfdA family dioxygenase, partial [Acidimicrobiia bacterium]|nr:TauD/TfdA family dioxygenase [Acidimicrobiia bacterium]